ncbi:hypothetical protein [Krasilnikovia sp. MM14-A1004]|uniref:hypothetical protein n=1 Tax=Krasilnikovia sp. MM14-A1004 TaxID=3373541 RepID=UPI00399CC278
MPDREPQEENREGHKSRLPRLLVWVGAGLAPVAAIVALVGGDTSMRTAVLLLAVCVVLIGASLLIRDDPVLLRMEVEDRVAAEVETMRGQLRAEVAAAARVTHHHVQALQDELGQMRGAVRPEPGIATGGRATVPAAVPHGAVPPAVSAAGPHGAVAPTGAAAPHGVVASTGAAGPHGAVASTGTAAPHGAAVARAGLPRPRGPVPPPSVARPPRNPPIAALPPSGPHVPPPSYDDTPYDDTPYPDTGYGDIGHGDSGDRPGEGGGKRRADITAVDLGYTGRRSRPDHTDDEFDYGPEPGHPGYGLTAPDPYDSDPLGDDYEWRQPSGHWDQRGRW